MVQHHQLRLAAATSSWDPEAIQLPSLNICYFITLNFKSSDVSISVLCLEKKDKAGRANTNTQGWTSKRYLDAWSGSRARHGPCALTNPKRPPALSDVYFQSCSGAVPPPSSAGNQVGTHHVKPWGSSMRKTILHNAPSDAIHPGHSSGTPFLQHPPETPAPRSARELLKQVFKLSID